MPDTDETRPEVPEFDFSAFPEDTLFLDRRTLGGERRGRPAAKAPRPAPAGERRERKERRRRVDPTTFEKQYSDAEMEFMNAVQSYKNQSGKSFPTHGDILRVAFSLGYRKPIEDDEPSDEGEDANLVLETCPRA